MGTIEGQRVLVMGASGGLGRSVGARLASQGARVAFAARRAELVAEAASAHDGAVGVACDVRDEASIDAAVATVVGQFEGLDALIYSTGVGELRRLAQADAEVWDRLLGTNVVGASLVTRACLPHLQATNGRAVYFSSVSASQTPPWPGLGSYIVSKAALDKLIDAWSVEHPEVAFTRLVMGDSGGGEGAEAASFAAGWDPEEFTAHLEVWFQRGYLSGALVDVDELARVLVAVLTTDASISSVVVKPPPGATMPDFSHLDEDAGA